MGTHQYLGGKTREGKSKYIKDLEDATDIRTKQQRETDEVFDSDDDIEEDPAEPSFIDKVFDFFGDDDEYEDPEEESYMED